MENRLSIDSVFLENFFKLIFKVEELSNVYHLFQNAFLF